MRLLYLIASVTIIASMNANAQVLFPSQPLLGPGGKAAEIHTDFDSAFYGNSIDNQFWLFEPKAPKPLSAPVVFFWHGTYTGVAHQLGAVLALDLFEYVKRGYIVVAPLYQHGSFDPSPSKKIDLFGSITKAALEEIKKPNHIPALKDDLGNISYGCVGYSLGGLVFAGASNYKKLGINSPKAIVGMLPFGDLQYAPYDGIPESTKVALISSESDIPETKDQAEPLHWPGLSHIPCENKVHAFVQNNPGLIADHIFPLRIAINALDYYAAWKFTFGMMDCALKNTHCEYVLTNKDSIAYLGKLSSGRALKPIIIRDGACKAITTNNFSPKLNNVIYQIDFNKAENTLNIIFQKEDNYQLSIINQHGNTISQDLYTKDKAIVNLTTFTTGVYIIRVISSNGVSHEKIIID